MSACARRCCLLQADSERQQQAWITAVQNSIASAFQERREDTLSPVRNTSARTHTYTHRHARSKGKCPYASCLFLFLCVTQRQRCSSMSVGSGGAGGGGSLGGGGGGGGMDQENQGCQALEEVQVIAGNQQCCDCGEANPDWASINLGITLCIVCSGIHRYTHTHMHMHTQINVK